MGREQKVAARVAVGTVVGILVLGWGAWWLLGQPDTELERYVQIVGLLMAALSAVAAVGSLFAALASRASAEASADTARRAQDALAYHFRPHIGWRTWSRHDWALRNVTPPDGGQPLQERYLPDDVLGQRVADLADRVTAQFWISEPHVESVRFWYTTEGEEERGPVLAVSDRLVDLPWVVAEPKDDDNPIADTALAPMNIRHWRIECYQPDGQMTWRAVGTITDPDHLVDIQADFHMVRGE
jgi:hypothetical protein